MITKQNRKSWNTNDILRVFDGYNHRPNGGYTNIIVEASQTNTSNTHSVTRNIDGIIYTITNNYYNENLSEIGKKAYFYLTALLNTPNCKGPIYAATPIDKYNKSSSMYLYRTSIFGRGNSTYYYHNNICFRPLVNYKE